MFGSIFGDLAVSAQLISRTEKKTHCAFMCMSRQGKCT